MAGAETYLHCSLVWERTILDERVFGPGSRVSVGESPRATFTLRAPGIGKKHVLFHHTEKRTELKLREGMLGRVRLAGRTEEAERLTGPEALAERNGDAVRYTLTEGDGGVLVFGRVGLAFDVVQRTQKVPPNPAARIVDSDPFTLKLFGVGLALVLLVSLVSRLFAGTRPDFTVEQLPERMVSFVVEDPEAARDFKKELRQLQQKYKKKRKKQKEIRDKPAEAGKTSRRPSNRSGRDSRGDAEEDRIRKKIADKGMVGALATARKKDGALQDLLDKGGLGMNLNTAVRALDRGAARARLLTSSGRGGMLIPTLTPRRGTADALGEGADEPAPDTGSTGRRMSRASRLAERREARVRVAMPSREARVTGGTLSRAQIYDVVKRNRGAIRYCYESQLMRYPTLRGRVEIDFIIDTSGRVSKVKVPTNTLAPAAARGNVSRCLMKFVSRWRFPQPRGGKARVIYPFTFGRSK